VRADAAASTIVLQRNHVPGITAVELTGVGQHVGGCEALLLLSVCSCELNRNVLPLIPFLVNELLEVVRGETKRMGNLVQRCHQVKIHLAVIPTVIGQIKFLNKNSTNIPKTGRPD